MPTPDKARLWSNPMISVCFCGGLAGNGTLINIVGARERCVCPLPPNNMGIYTLMLPEAT